MFLPLLMIKYSQSYYGLFQFDVKKKKKLATSQDKFFLRFVPMFLFFPC